MALRNYISIDTDDLPETFEYDLDGNTYQLTFKYNDEGDFFTCDIADDSGNKIVTGEKLILNQPLFKDNPDERLPVTPLVPIDESGQATNCGIDEFGSTVFLYEDTLDPDLGDSGDMPVDADVEGGYE